VTTRDDAGTTSPGSSAIVLAAGQGTRMKSDVPKVLHRLAGRPMIDYPLHAALDAGIERVIVVVGHGRDAVTATLSQRFDARVTMAVQNVQRGSGDAARVGLDALTQERGWVLIVNGDCPLIDATALRALLEAARGGSGPLALLTIRLSNPAGYGRIVRDAHGAVLAIREDRDCSVSEKEIAEVNPGVYAIELDFLRRTLHGLSASNAQGELYLTDLIAEAATAGGVTAVLASDLDPPGVNDRFELAVCEAVLRRRIARAHAVRGVTIRDPGATYIDADVRIGVDATIEPGVVLRGHTVVGDGAHVDVGCVLDDVVVAPHARLKPYTVATRSQIGERAQVGPFSHLRPGSELGPDVHLGNFVETKNTTMAAGAKANHLAYLGDGIIGERTNVGAGTIFCNYDGFQKHVTVLEDEVFVGSDSQLIAPVRVGRASYVASGTTVTKDVPADALAVSRVPQQNKEGAAPRLRAKLRAAAEARKNKGSK